MASVVSTQKDMCPRYLGIHQSSSNAKECQNESNTVVDNLDIFSQLSCDSVAVFSIDKLRLMVNAKYNYNTDFSLRVLQSFPTTSEGNIYISDDSGSFLFSSFLYIFLHERPNR